MKERKESQIINAIRHEVETENSRQNDGEVKLDCSETNCSTYCSDHHDADH